MFFIAMFVKYLEPKNVKSFRWLRFVNFLIVRQNDCLIWKSIFLRTLVTVFPRIVVHAPIYEIEAMGACTKSESKLSAFFYTSKNRAVSYCGACATIRGNTVHFYRFREVLINRWKVPKGSGGGLIRKRVGKGRCLLPGGDFCCQVIHIGLFSLGPRSHCDVRDSTGLHIWGALYNHPGSWDFNESVLFDIHWFDLLFFFYCIFIQCHRSQNSWLPEVRELH